MTISTLDSKSALIVVDVQKGIVPNATPIPFDLVVRNSARLATLFRELGRPVALARVIGGMAGRKEHKDDANVKRPENWMELVDELDRRLGDIFITKQTWGAFSEPDLHESLKSRAVTQVVLTGCATSLGVESTARQAHELGYHVVLVRDAMTDIDADAHYNSIERIFPRLGEVGSTAEVEALLS